MSKISKEQVNQALAKISQNMSNRPCPFCGSMEGYTFNQNASDIFATEGLETVISHGYIDSIPVITGYCKHCGYIVQFSLTQLGIIKKA